MSGSFRYFRDPAFLTALTLYLVNRGLLKPLTLGHVGFFHDYFNDLLCIPFWLPVCLWVYRRIGIRWHDRAPTRFEVLSHLIIWSLCFEWLGPALKGPFAWTVADPWDVAAYTIGTVIAGAFWGTWRPAVRREGHLLPEARREESPA
jgi:hypothetical protein